MAKPGSALKPKLDAIIAKFDAIIPKVEKAVNAREAYKTAKASVAQLKKDVDDQTKKVDACKAKNEEFHKKQVDAAKEIEKWATTVEKWDDVMKKNKTIADAVGRLKVWSTADLKAQFNYWDDEAYQNLATKLGEKRKILPKPDGSNKLPQDLGILEGKVDDLIKKFQDAAKTAKTGKQTDKDYWTKTRAYEAKQKQIQPVEDALDQSFKQIFTDVDAAQTLSTGVAYDAATPDAIKRAFADVDGDLYEARVDYHDVKVADWAAKP